MNASHACNSYGCGDLAPFEPHKTAQRRARMLELVLRRSCFQARVIHDPVIGGAFYSYRVLTAGHELILEIPWREIAAVGVDDLKAVVYLADKLEEVNDRRRGCIEVAYGDQSGSAVLRR